MSITAPADKRFRRAHLRPGRKRPGWASWQWRAAAAVVVLGLTGYAAHRALNVLVGLRVLGVQRILVHGNHRLSNGEVLALVEGLRGENILTMSLDEWRANVMNSRWVADALLRRTLPSTVDITVHERSPLGIGRINGSLYLVDEAGVVIDEYGPNYGDLDLPIIDGFSSARGESRPDVSRAFLVRRLLDALRVRNLAARVSQIDVSDARNAVVLVDGDSTSVRLGDDHFVERLQSYLELAPALRERVPEIEYVDMRFDDRVYVRPASQAAAVGSLKASGTRTKGQGAKS